MREIIFDTETTGLYPAQGHKLVEIGAIEVIDGKKTGNYFQTYLNPKRELDPRAAAVNGLSQELLKNEPEFQDMAFNFMKFVKNGHKTNDTYARLIAHNAPFDIGFLQSEYSKSDYELLMTNVEVVDTKKLAQVTFAASDQPPLVSYSLDSLCKHFEIDIGHRQVHGAIKDCELLYLMYTELRKFEQSIGVTNDNVPNL